MLDWLKRSPTAEPEIEIDGRRLPIVVRRLERARRLTMRLAADGQSVRISMPPWTRTEEALAFARSRRDWLATQLRAHPESEPLGDGATLAFRGQPIRLRHDPTAPRRPALSDAT
ncbi:M48 family metallopeptidase, partial [Novosphingobium sp. 1949]